MMFFALLGGALQAGTAAGPALIGTVVDDTGKPVSGAGALISYALPAGPGQPAVPSVVTGALAATATADAQGVFNVPSLPPGQYIACAETVAPGLLDPCHWAASAPTFAVRSGVPTSVKIVMTRGAVLSIHLADPLALLPAASSPAGPMDFNLELHVVTQKGLHYSAPIQSRTAVGRDHAITIPFDTPVTLRVLAAHLLVNDQSGTPVSAVGTIITVPLGTQPQALAYTVVGKK
jgi:hypothetical protein